MDLNRHSTSSPTLPAITTSGNTAGYFTKGNPSLGVPATIPTADWCNGIQSEIANAILESGQTLSQTNLQQLIQAIGNIGKRKNRLINANFDHWTYGTSSTASGYTTADKWKVLMSGPTKTTSRQAFTLGQTDVPGNPRYYMRNVVSSVAGASNYCYMSQCVEFVKSLSGQQVVVSFYAKADAAKNIAVEFSQNFGTSGSPSSAVSVPVQKIALTTSWAKYSVSVSLPSISGKTLGTDGNDHLQLLFWFDAGSTYDSRTGALGQQSGTFDIGRVQLEPGSIATEFEYKNIREDLADCQRVHWRGLPAGAVNGSSYTSGAIIFAPVKFPVTMRTVPTLTSDFSGTTYVSATGAAISTASPEGCRFYAFSTGVGVNVSAVFGANDYIDAFCDF